MSQEIGLIPNKLRQEVLKMVSRAGAGHVAGPLSASEILTAIYFGGETRVNPSDPWSEERDRFILSCGHYSPLLYATLAMRGYFEMGELARFMKVDGPSTTLGIKLPGHPEYRSIPGVEATTGSLGQGVSFAVGQAISIKLKYGERAQKETPRVICLMSDGELQEGQVWEAFNFAVRRQLDNLTFMIDKNRIQIGNYVSQVSSSIRMEAKLEAFGLHVLEVEGNDLTKVRQALMKAREVRPVPCVIVCKTTAGKGVTFMENKPEWHDKVPNRQEMERALVELTKI